MNKLAIASILGATIVIAAMFAFMPIEKASTAPPPGKGPTAGDVNCTGCVDTVDIADGAVTLAKLAPDAQPGAGVISTYTVIGSPTSVGTGTGLFSGSASCQSGDRVLSGGFFMPPWLAEGSHIEDSFPELAIDPNNAIKWNVNFVKTETTSSSGALQVIVLCADITP